MTWTADMLAQCLARGHVKVHSIANARMVRRDENASEKRGPKPLPKPPKIPKPIVTLEDQLNEQLKAAGLNLKRQFKWMPNRKYRADFAHIESRTLVELDGAVHRIKAQWRRDMLKRQNAIQCGWRMLPIGTWQVRNGTAAELVRQVIAMATEG